MGQNFHFLIAQCIRWKTGDELQSKQPHDLLRALVYLWIRIWGPMQTLMSDQEGGFVSNEATAFFDRLGIGRVLVGTDGSTTKGLVERHIQLTKLGMLRFKRTAKDSNINVTDGECCQEICQAQNLLLDYAGGVHKLL